MSASVDDDASTKTFIDGDLTFTEDKHDEIIQERLKQDKGGKLSRFLRRTFGWSDESTFSPKLLTDEEFRQIGEECERESLQLLTGDGWKKEKVGPLPGDLIEAMHHKTYGKIFRLSGIVDCPPEVLYKQVAEDIENMPKWNPTILHLKVVKEIDPNTSIVYQITTGGPKDVVKPRDFVNVRRVSRVEGRLYSSAVSAEYIECPPTDKYIRGHNHVGCWAIEPRTEDGIEKSLFQWIMACDLKGWIPQYIIDIAFSTAQLEFLQHLRNHATSMKNNGLF